jgi:pyrroloquinoline quinone biosynthesis protein D
MTDQIQVGEESTPKLAAHVTMKFDKHRDRWVILAPERVLMLDQIAAEILNRCDGKSVAAIIDDLTATFEAPRQDIANDVIAMLQDMADKGTIVA